MYGAIQPPQIVQTEDEFYAGIHVMIPRSEMRAVLPPTLQELHAALKAQGLPIKPWFAHHLTLNRETFDFEACLPVDQPFVADGRVQPGVWPGGTVARTFFHGDYAGLPSAWKEFHTWIVDNGHRCATHIYERYVVNHGTTHNAAEYRTELSWPLLP